MEKERKTTALGSYSYSFVLCISRKEEGVFPEEGSPYPLVCRLDALILDIFVEWYAVLTDMYSTLISKI